MPGRFSVRFFAVRRLSAVGIPVLKRAGPMVSPVFCLCGRRPGSVRCDDAASPPLFFCRSVLPLRPAAPSCCSVLPLRLAAPSCRSVLPLRLAAPSCRSVLPLRPAAPSCRSVLPPRLAAPSCRPVLPLCPAVHLTAPFCRLVLPPHRPGSAGFARTAHAISSLFPRSGENPPAVKLRFCMT